MRSVRCACYALGKQEAANGNGYRGAPSREVARAQSWPAEDDAQAITRLRGDPAQGLTGNEEAWTTTRKNWRQVVERYEEYLRAYLTEMERLTSLVAGFDLPQSEPTMTSVRMSLQTEGED